MTSAFAAKLGFYTWLTGIDAQDINESTLEIYDIVITRLSIQDKLGKIHFFDENFLLADTRIKVVLEMSFLALSNIDI